MGKKENEKKLRKEFIMYATLQFFNTVTGDPRFISGRC